MKTRAPKESSVEQHLVARVRALGGVALKIVPVSCSGLPDRVILLPGGRLGFLELKRPGATVDPEGQQAWWIKRLSALGFVADWTSSRDGADAFVQRVLDSRT